MLSLVDYVMRGGGAGGAGGAAGAWGDSTIDSVGMVCATGVSACGSYVQSGTVSWQLNLEECFAVVIVGDVEIVGGLNMSWSSEIA